MTEKIVPLPQRVTPSGGEVLRLGSAPRVAVPSESLRELGEVVVDLLRRLHRVEPVLVVGGEGDLTLGLTQEPPDADIAGVQGIDPLDEDHPSREVYGLDVREDGAAVTASSAEGLFRGATTFAQLLRPEAGGGFTVPGVRIVDGPAMAWRGLSLDVVRCFFTVEQVKKVIDLLALYKFNVLHLHLSDSQAWRLEIAGWPRLTGGGSTGADDLPSYTRDDYREIVGYAAARFITVVPELDMPGHVLAAVRAYPELRGDGEPPHKWLAYLDPRAEVTFRFVRDVLGELAALTPGPYLHVGGDEAFGMPEELYGEFVARALEIARATGKKVVGWQETARSGALTPADVAQAWIGAGDEFDLDAARAKTPAEYHPLLDIVAETFARSAGDVPAAVAAGVPVLASASSVMYLDRRYAEGSLRAGQTARRTEVGHDSYTPRTCRELFDWAPGTLTEIPDGARLAGVEAAIWCETVEDFDDLVFLLLPRLPGIAEKAWTPSRTDWDAYRGRVAAHAHWWDRLGLDGYYRSAEVFGP
ncbi:family 20 glycosylhydrolase [Actinomadura sp. KC345]|uniref:family 20 glycosylhydrolase n=1 Tax=Actinomadura sp. KC345 TaxID=2530371 RepID=UPI0014054F3B|nr:family 20 glycosylhydrolase [Actinomadura sp. KC345]